MITSWNVLVSSASQPQLLKTNIINIRFESEFFKFADSLSSVKTMGGCCSQQFLVQHSLWGSFYAVNLLQLPIFTCYQSLPGGRRSVFRLVWLEPNSVQNIHNRFNLSAVAILA